MNTIFQLAKLDFLLILRWFKKSTFSKLLVMLVFIFIFAALSLFLFLFSRVFFQNLAAFSVYGKTTTYYIIHAAIIMILWLSLVSSLTATFTYLTTPNFSRDYLLVLPVKSFYISLWLFLKASFINLFLFLLIFAPIAISYARSFAGGINSTFLVQLVILSSLLVLASGSLGTVTAYYLTSFYQKFEKLGGLIGGLFFLIISFLLIQLIFPKSFITLYEVPSEKFFDVYNHLPLVGLYLPTRALTNILVYGISANTLFMALEIILFAILTLIVEADKFIPLLQVIRGKGQNIKKTVQNSPQVQKMIRSSYPLVIKDFRSIIRLPSETNYALFLLAIGSFFFLLLSKATSVRPIEKEHIRELIVFSYAWLLFFSTALFLRLVFPLMAREGTSIWYIFTLPIKKRLILGSKLIVGLLLTLPLIGVAFLLWLIMPFASGFAMILILLSVIDIIIISLIQTCLGVIHPNFSQSKDPEKVSTSAMGIATLLVCLAIIGISGKILSDFMTQNKEIWLAILPIFIGEIILVTILYFLALHFVKNYEFTTI